jgi:hypothetical protein
MDNSISLDLLHRRKDSHDNNPQTLVNPVFPALSPGRSSVGGGRYGDIAHRRLLGAGR